MDDGTLKFTAKGEAYEIDLNKLMFVEARAIESATGLTMTDLLGEDGGMSHGSALALQAVIWIAVKRKTPATKFSDLDEWAIADIEFIPDEPATDKAEPATPDPTGGDEPA